MSDLQWQIGSVRITRIAESEMVIALGNLCAEATREALARHRGWLQPHFLEDDGESTRLSIHAFVIESQGRRIVVDTCVGEHSSKAMGPALSPNPFLERLATAGYPCESIDVVLCTHLHFDHVGWNTRRDGDRWMPTFPHARYLFARREWEHWVAAADREEWVLYSETIEPILAANLQELVEPDHRLTDEVRLIPTPGHTPGHVSVLIESGGQRALITGDMCHHPVQWAEPWGSVADTDRAAAVATRSRIVAAHADDPHCLILGTHFAPPTAGHLVRRDGGVQFQAAVRPKE